MKIMPRLGCCSVLLACISAVSGAPAIKTVKETVETKSEGAEFTIGPDYANAPETQVRPNVPKGEFHEFTMGSRDSKIYKGIAKGKKGEVPYQRKVAVYVPSQYRPSKEVPFIVIQDGMGYRDVVSKVLDNMIEQKRLPVLVAVFVNSGGGDAQGSQRGLEYDSVDDTYTKFSEKDNGWNRDEASLHNWVMANQRMAAELKAKDYDYRYVFAKNAGHTDGKVTWQTLPGALEWLWQGYPLK